MGCDVLARGFPSCAASFNPRTRVGCDRPGGPKMTPCRCFNPRTRVGCDVLLAAFALCGVGFNPRTRVGCDDIAAWVLHSKSMFQSTHPRGVRHDKAVAAEAAIAFQSTHPRGVRPARWYCMACQDRVSIHAPAWGATRRPRGHHELLYVSIHAPAWGATFASLEQSFYQLLFQSTHPRGVRRTACRALL